VAVKSFIGHKWSFRNEFGDYMIPLDNLPDNGEKAQYYIVPSPASRNYSPSDSRYRHFQAIIINRIHSLVYYAIKRIIQVCGKERYKELNLAAPIMKQIDEVAKDIQEFEDVERTRVIREAHRERRS